MAYYKVCPHCGTRLDLAEVCDCRKDRMRQAYDLILKLSDEQLDRITQEWEKDTALGAANTEGGGVEQVMTGLNSTFIITGSEV